MHVLYLKMALLIEQCCFSFWAERLQNLYLPFKKECIFGSSMHYREDNYIKIIQWISIS